MKNNQSMEPISHLQEILNVRVQIIQLQLCQTLKPVKHEKPKVEGKCKNTSAFHTKDLHTLNPPNPKHSHCAFLPWVLQMLPMDQWGMRLRGSETSLKEWGMQMEDNRDDIRLISHQALGWPDPSQDLYYARQIKKTAAHTQTGPAKGRKGR